MLKALLVVFEIDDFFSKNPLCLKEKTQSYLLQENMLARERKC